MYESGSFACEKRAVRVVGNTNSITKRSSLTPHTSDVGAEKVGDEDMIEVSIDPVDEDLQGKEVSMHSFDPRKYKRKNIWLNISQVGEVTSPLRAVSQKHGDTLIESLKSNK